MVYSCVKNAVVGQLVVLASSMMIAGKRFCWQAEFVLGKLSQLSPPLMQLDHLLLKRRHSGAILNDFAAAKVDHYTRASNTEVGPESFRVIGHLQDFQYRQHDSIQLLPSDAVSPIHDLQQMAASELEKKIANI